LPQRERGKRAQGKEGRFKVTPTNVPEPEERHGWEENSEVNTKRDERGGRVEALAVVVEEGDRGHRTLDCVLGKQQITGKTCLKKLFRTTPDGGA